jgi:hypothetical protein
MLFEQDISYTHKFYDMRGLKAKRLFNSKLPQLAWDKRLLLLLLLHELKDLGRIYREML